MDSCEEDFLELLRDEVADEDEDRRSGGGCGLGGSGCRGMLSSASEAEVVSIGFEETSFRDTEECFRSPMLLLLPLKQEHNLYFLIIHSYI
jgi:hypothetical protein